jgi:hypothetical protein
MRVAILSDPPDLSPYLQEILKTWGCFVSETISPGELGHLDPVNHPILICPAGSPEAPEALIGYVEKGGNAICFLPQGDVAKAAGLLGNDEKEPPLRLRVTSFSVPGLAGESLPVVGKAQSFEPGPEARPLAYLYHPGRYLDESPGITEISLGLGRITAFAFDLPLAVLYQRQGDPQLAEVLPAGEVFYRPAYLAADAGPNDSSWIPYTDLLCQVLVANVRRLFPSPCPTLWHLPGKAAGMILYSGDEDFAPISNNDDQQDSVIRGAGRMNLYIIPGHTRSSREDVDRYRENHDVGPHPDLRPLDGRPVQERLADFEHQIRLFEEKFGVKARSLRNHCTAWAGYLEPVEIMERLGIGMDANYLYGTLLLDRADGPYSGFGAAMPMRFCQPDGRLFSVFQQHTHLMDDLMFLPQQYYSFKLAPEQYETMLKRIIADMVTRFHSPYAVCIHPSNWAKFSRPQSQALLQQASEADLPIWSNDQWLHFWEDRDALEINDLSWDGATLECSVSGIRGRDDISLNLPTEFAGVKLQKIEIGGQSAILESEIRYGGTEGFTLLPRGEEQLKVRAEFS